MHRAERPHAAAVVLVHRDDPRHCALLLEAESAGFDSVWTAEAYGSDAATPLAWFAAQTERIKLGAAGYLNKSADPDDMVAAVRKAMPDDGIVCLDNGVYKIWFARNYRARRPNTVLLDNALATMGAGLPSAIAAKQCFPDRKVMAVCGDGGFMMNSQELETAVRLKLDLIVLILNDNAYGMIKWKQSNMGFQNFGLDYGNPDFVKYAEAYGAQGHRPASADEFIGLLKRCQADPGVHVIDLAIDYSDNDRVLNHEIREQSAQL